MPAVFAVHGDDRAMSRTTGRPSNARQCQKPALFAKNGEQIGVCVIA